MGLTYTELEINGVLLIDLPVFSDERGSFLETFNEKNLLDILPPDIKWVQDNMSISKINVFRGLHFQRPPYAQDKLVRVSHGKVLDVLLDLRKGSSTFKRSISVELNSIKPQLLFVPKGLAHGFLSLEENSCFNYKCSNYYHPQSEDCIDIKTIGQSFLPKSDLVMNSKDRVGRDLETFTSPFE